MYSNFIIKDIPGIPKESKIFRYATLALGEGDKKWLQTENKDKHITHCIIIECIIHDEVNFSISNISLVPTTATVILGVSGTPLSVQKILLNSEDPQLEYDDAVEAVIDDRLMTDENIVQNIWDKIRDREERLNKETYRVEKKNEIWIDEYDKHVLFQELNMRLIELESERKELGGQEIYEHIESLKRTMHKLDIKILDYSSSQNRK